MENMTSDQAPESRFMLRQVPLKNAGLIPSNHSGSLLDDLTFADLIVKCGAYEFKVHRAIVCNRSEYFKKAAVGEFREAQQQVLTFTEDEPALVARFITFLYSGSYEVDRISDTTKKGRAQFRNVLEFSDYAKKDRTIMKDQTTRQNQNEDARPMTEVFLHAKMYAVGAKYNVRDLMRFSRKQFSHRYVDWDEAHSREKPGKMTEQHLALIEFIYTSTADNDRGLKDLVLLGIQVSLSGYGCEDMKNVIFRFVQTTSLAIDMCCKPMLPRVCHECQQCKKTRAVLREICECGNNWADACGKCKTTFVNNMECFFCFTKGQMQAERAKV